MKLIFSSALILAIGLVTFTSCKKDDPVTITVDSSQPQGTFAASKTGTIVAQSGTPSKGTITYGVDSKNVAFVKFGSDFVTELGTGTVSVYMSTSETFKADPAKGNPDLKLVGPITKNGENYIKIEPALNSKFTHLILWCGTAGVPFGNAKLQ
jgi:hypothetical protein